MNLVIPIIAIVGAVLAALDATGLSERVRLQSLRASVAIGWLGVLGGAGGLYAGELSGIGTPLGVAACAGLLVLPVGMRLASVRSFASLVGALIPLVVGVLGLVVEADIAGGRSAELLLYAGHWGALSAALVSALVAATFAASEGWRAAVQRDSRDRQDRRAGGEQTPDDEKTPGLGLGVALAALPLGAYLLGVLRAGAGGIGWALPLSANGGDVTWQIPPTGPIGQGGEVFQGLALDAVYEVGWMGPLLISAAVVALASGVAAHMRAGRRAVAFGWFVSAAASLAGLLGALTSRASATLPDASAYRETARELLSDVAGAQMLVEQGSFVSDGDIGVSLASIAAELGMLGVAALLGALAGLYSLRKGWPGAAAQEPGRASTALFARDFSLRAIILGWLSWLLVTLIHWSHFGAVGAGSTAEWTALGILVSASALVLLSWRRRNSRLERIVRGVVPGVVFALFLIGLAVSLVFNAPFGLSIVF